MKEKLLSKIGRAAVAVALGLFTFGLSPQAQAADPVSYMTWDGTQKMLVSTTCTSYTLVTSADTEWSGTVNGGWYVVGGTTAITINNTVTCKGEVHLILKDGAKLTVTGEAGKAGICVSGDGNSLAVYGQSGQSGELIVTGGNYAAGIGGGSGKSIVTGSNITINGGVVTAKGGTGNNGGAGIGGGYTGAGTNITINGGVVTATGGNFSAGIGGGGENTGSDITINGGVVTATGAAGGAGIGGGDSGAGTNITINGGTVNATGAAGGAGIGGGSFGGGSNITINGGNVTATGAANNSLGGAGIGGGHKGAGSNITIDGGTVTATAGDADGIGSGKNSQSAASEIKAAASSAVKVSTDNTTWNTIDHTAAQDISSDLAGKQYVKVLPPVAYMEPVYKTVGGVTSPTNGIDHWETKSVTDYNLVKADTAALNEGWWVVDGTVDHSSAGIVVNGAAHLILKDGCSLTVRGRDDDSGIQVSGIGNSLAIYGQSTGTGKLTATGDGYCAGIGGSYLPYDGSNITINGGTVISMGGSSGAGIGGGCGGTGSNITINGGTVTATGGNNGAGIGGGCGGTGSNITINGGTVTATGGSDGAAGIGNGDSGKSSATNIKINPLLTLKAGANENPTTVIPNTGADLATALKNKRYATTAINYTLVLKDGEAYKDKAEDANKITEGAKAAGLAYADNVWTMSNFVFTTTAHIALDVEGETTIKVVGQNFLHTADSTETINTYGIASTTNLTIQGGSLSDKLNVSCGACGGATFGFYIGGDLKIEDAEVTAAAGTSSKANSATVNLGSRSLTVNNASVYADKAGSKTGVMIGDGKITPGDIIVSGTGMIHAAGSMGGVISYSATEPDATAKSGEATLAWKSYQQGAYAYFNGDDAATDVTLTAPVPPVQIPSAPTEITGTTHKVYTNGVESAEGTVWSNGTATVVYTAEAGYTFEDGSTVSTNELDTSVNPAVNKTPAPAVIKWVKLSDVDILDSETGVTNATATVYVNDTQVTANPDGTYPVPAGTPIKITYTVTENALFGSCLKDKDLWLNDGIADDYKMTDEDKEPILAALKPAWADEREIALDTRERIVVAAPTNVLPIAYSTNFWATTEDWASCNRVRVAVTNPAGTGALIAQTVENGYAEWFPAEGAYGKYTLTHKALGSVTHDVSAEIYYTTYFPLTITQPAEGGTIAATTNGAAATGAFDVLGYEYVNLTATPIFNGEARYDFKGWSATTNGIAYAEGFTNTTTVGTRFEMPNSEATIKGAFTWKTRFTDMVTVNPGETWNIYDLDDYVGGITNNGTVVWKPGVTNKLGRAYNLHDCWQLHNGENGKLQIVFDATLTNGLYKIAEDYLLKFGWTFEITNGSDAKNCKVIDEANLETMDWVYVGAKRFKMYVNSSGKLMLLVEPGIPMPLDFTSPVEGGSFTVSTNDASLNSGDKIYPSEKVVLAFAPANAQWQADTNTLMLVDADAVTNDVSYFTGVTLDGATFKMTETNATFSMAFMISDGYRAALLKAAEANYAASTNAIEQLRQNRLTEAETDDVLQNALTAFTAATNGLVAAYKPVEGDSATNTLAGALTQYESDAKTRSDAKPWTITVDANATADGTNVFNTIDAAFAATDFMPYATNLVVIGEQRATVAMPAMRFGWNLVVTNWQAEATYDDAKSPYKQSRLVLEAAVQTQQFLSKLVKVTGEGRILLANEGRKVGAEAVASNLRDRIGGDPATAAVQVIATRHDAVIDGGKLGGEYVAIDSYRVTRSDIHNPDVITNRVIFVAPVVTNETAIYFDLTKDNHDTCLVNVDDVTMGAGSSFQIMLDADQTEGDVVTNYVIAGRASSAAHAMLSVRNDADEIVAWVTVGGATQYVGAKAYTAFLVTDENDATQSNLVFDVAWGKFAITYDPAPGAWADGSTSTNIDAYVNRGYEFPATDPVREGYVFKGWYRSWTNGAEQVTETNVAASAVLPLAEHTLYAQWEEDANPETRKAISDFLPSRQPRLEITRNDGFVGNRKIETLDMPLFVKSVGQFAFRGATGLKTINFVQPHDYGTFAPVSLQIADGAFGGCTALGEVRIPSYVTSVGQYAFSGCTNLKDIYLLGNPDATVFGTKPFIQCGTKVGGLTVHLSPEAAANAELVYSITNGATAKIVIDPLLANEIAPDNYAEFTVGAETLSFKLNVSAVPEGTPLNTATVSALFAECVTGLCSGEVLRPTSVSAPDENGDCLIVFPKPTAATGFLRLTVNPQNGR